MCARKKLGFDAVKMKKARIACGYSMSGLAWKLRLSVTTIWQYEAGQRTPRIETLRRIEEELGLSAGALLR
jgi:transcriptional regulator with XRE-family HTH domain